MLRSIHINDASESNIFCVYVCVSSAYLQDDISPRQAASPAEADLHIVQSTVSLSDVPDLHIAMTLWLAWRKHSQEEEEGGKRAKGDMTLNGEYRGQRKRRLWEARSEKIQNTKSFFFLYLHEKGKRQRRSQSQRTQWHCHAPSQHVTFAPLGGRLKLQRRLSNVISR